MKKLILLLPLILLASVSVQVNKTHIHTGEDLIITITAEGKNIKFPNLSKIAGFDVIGTSISNNIVAINGNIKETVSKSFVIMPDRNFTIPSFSVSVNGKIYKTKPIKITVTTPKQTKGPYTLDINLSKNKAYIGEDIILTMKYHEKKEAASVNIQKPTIPGAIVKLINKKPIKNGVVYHFLVIPQKAGHFKIGPFIANVGEEVEENLFNDPFFTMKSIKYKTIFSNQLTLDVYPIPQNAVYGNFKLNLKASRTIEASKPNKVLLTIKGCGDFVDLPEFHLDIPNATVYEKKPILNTKILNSKMCGEYIKEFDVIADSNYTIPPITLKEFNSTLHTLKTKPIDVHVIGGTSKQTAPTPQKKIIKQHSHAKTNYLPLILIFIAGTGVGIIIAYIYYKQDPIIRKIKRAKEKELFNILLAYEKHPKIKEILNKLDENIYQNKNHQIDKKEIIKIIKELRQR
jgi:hypothetical protein